MTDERNRDWAAIHDPATTADQLTVIGQRYPEFLPAIVERLGAPTVTAPGATDAVSSEATAGDRHPSARRPRRATAAWIIIAALVALWATPGAVMGAGRSALWVLLLSVALTTATAITVLITGLVEGRGTGRKVAAVAASFAVFWPPAIATSVVLILGTYDDVVALLFVGLGVAALGVLTAWVVVMPRAATAYWSLAVSGVVIILVGAALWFVPAIVGSEVRWVVELVLQVTALCVVPLVCALTLGRRAAVAA